MYTYQSSSLMTATKTKQFLSCAICILLPYFLRGKYSKSLHSASSSSMCHMRSSRTIAWFSSYFEGLLRKTRIMRIFAIVMAFPSNNYVHYAKTCCIKNAVFTFYMHVTLMKIWSGIFNHHVVL